MMNIDTMPKDELRRILDLLVREVNYAWWSEGCLFNLTQAESDEVEKFMAAYNRDGHLDLLINYEEMGD